MDQAPPRSDGRWLALAVLTIARVSLGYQYQSIASVSPFLIEDLGLSYGEVGTLVGLYMLPGIALSLPGALIGRRFGDQRTVIFGLALMALGGVLAGFSGTHRVLLVARLLSGTGGILLTVLMTKMVTDWFAGREIVLAMAIFMNSFPIGIGLALMSLGFVAELGGWRMAMHTGAAVALVGLVLLMLAYRRHPNDGRGAARPARSGTRLERRELGLVCLAGAIWGTCNGALAITLSFAPLLLVASGRSVVEAGFLVGLAGWLLVASVQAGGLLAQRGGRADAVMRLGLLGWGFCLLLMPVWPTLSLLAAGLMMGLPVGVILSLPAAALRPESRALGMGVFQTCNSALFAVLPTLAGGLQDVTGSPSAPFLLAAALTLGMMLGLSAFRAVQARRVR